MTVVKIQTDKQHRRLKTFQTVAGQISFDRSGITEVDVRYVRALFAHDPSLYLVNPEDEAKVQEVSYSEEDVVDYGLQINEKEQEVLTLKQELKRSERTILDLTGLVGDKDKEISRLLEEIKTIKADKVELTEAQLEYAKELNEFLLVDLQAIAKDGTFPAKEWNKLEKEDMIKYLVNKLK